MKFRNVHAFRCESLSSRLFAFDRNSVLILILAILISVSSAAASTANVYIAQSATGAANGADCADAYAYTFFNASANWGAGPSQIGPGTTVHLCGTITGSAGGTGLNFQGSGSSGNPVTLLFESGASLQAPYWGTGGGSPTGAIEINGQSYIVINGGATGNAGAGTFVANGVIENTEDGTSGGSCAGGSCSYQADSTGIGLQDVSNITIENLTIENIYVRTSLSDENGYGYGIQKLGTASTVTISNVVIAQMEADIWWNLVSGSDSSLVISDSDISNCSAGVGIAQGSGNTGVLSSFTFSGNHVHDFASWNETSAYNFHHDGIHIYSYTTPLTGISVYNNQFTGNLGSGTAWIYYEQYASGSGAINIFNNIVDSYATQSGNGAGGARSIEFEGNAISGKIYNNTIIGVLQSATIMSGIYNNGSPAASMDIRNNIISGNLEALVEGSGIATTSNNNDYDFSGGSSIEVNGLGYNASNFSAWQSTCSCDSSSITSTPDLASNFQPLASSPVLGAGQNLTSEGITALDSDYAGTQRPGLGAGNWDIGAYEDPATPPAPPSSVVAVPH